MASLHISLAAETIGHIGNFPITNALLTTWLVMAILFAFGYFATKSIKKVPGHFQSIAEILIGGLYSFFITVLGDHTKKVFPVIATFFLFIMFSNWSGLIPGVGTIGFFKSETEKHEAQLVQPVHATVHDPAADSVETLEAEVVSLEHASGEPQTESVDKEKKSESHKTEFVPLFRGPTADLNTTLALAIVAVVFIQVFGLQTLGTAYLGKFFDFSNPIAFFVGILELISDFSKIISYAFRLFGNIFAGEVLLSVMAFLMPVLLPTPFIALELFVGFIQALVFSMLTAVFLNVAVAGHGGHHEDTADHH